MASDSIQTQKDIFEGIQGLLAFLDTTDEKKNRANTEAWKNTLESLRNITSNPLPFLLELLKILKQKKSNEKAGQKAKKMRAAKRKKRIGQKNKTEDGKWKVVYHENGVPMEQIFDSNEEASLFYGVVMATSN